jgi:hypothetical protein
MNGMSAEQMKSDDITMDLIHKFREMMVADLGDDEKFFWKGLVYTISKDNDTEPEFDINELDPNERAALEYDTQEYDNYLENM